MNIKPFTIIAMALALSSCGGGENSDGSKASTYSSCSIISSEAFFANDRARDISQCWDGVNYKEKSLALDWCAKKVNSYMSRYIFGHTVEYKVASTNCPAQRKPQG